MSLGWWPRDQRERTEPLEGTSMTETHRGTSSFCGSTVPEVPKTTHHPHLPQVHPSSPPAGTNLLLEAQDPPGTAGPGDLGALGQAVSCGSCKEPSGHHQGTCPKSFCPSVLLFSFLSRASFREALPSPLLQPPPLSLRLSHQTKHICQGNSCQRLLCWSRCPRVPLANRNCHILLPVCHTASPTCVHTLCGSAVLGAGWGHRALFPELTEPCFQG